ncbi:MAG: glycosyltransferase, partial [Phycisphaerales bacterium]|nr:glycosyltransferase [Phycisphaerales bacterium]
MKILHYLKRTRLEEGGVVRAVLDVCAILASSGQDVTLMTFDDTDAPKDWDGRAGMPRVVRLDAPRFAGRLPGSAVSKASELMRAHDVLHLHTLWTPSNGQLAAAARKAGTPYVVTIHGMLDDWCMTQRALKKKIYLALSARRVLEEARMVHCTASGELEQARQWFSNSRTTVIPLVFDTSPFRDLPGTEPAMQAFPVLREATRTLLFLSRVHYKKGIEHLIDASALLREQGLEHDVLVAGHGEAPYVEQ